MSRQGRIGIGRAAAQKTIQSWVMRYDNGGDEHDHTICVFIMSVRGSAAAALCWLATTR